MKTKHLINKIKQIVFLFIITCNLSFAYEDRVVAVVNDNVVLESELSERLANIDLNEMTRLQSVKLKRDVLDNLIEESLLEQAANRLGINISDIDLQNQVKRIATSQNLTVLQLKDAVERQNINYFKYLNNVRKKIQIQELFRTQFISRAYVSEEELNSYLNNNQSIQIDGTLDLTEYIIEDESQMLDVAKINIIMENIKKNGYEDTIKRYPDFNIIVSNINNTALKELPDVYQNNLKILDSKRYSNYFRTGKGYVLLKVDNSSLLTDEYNVSHILMKTNPMEDIDYIKNKFYEIKNMAIKDNDFAKYAKKYSLDTASAIKGGSLGWIDKEMVVPQFRNVMIKAKVGDISEPFKTKFGWHILFLEDKRTRNIAEKVIRNKAINILKERKVEVAKREWLTKLKDQAYIEIVDE
jgi:peptidyl-prolyl cis-trans isomerase SurA